MIFFLRLLLFKKNEMIYGYFHGSWRGIYLWDQLTRHETGNKGAAKDDIPCCQDGVMHSLLKSKNLFGNTIAFWLRDTSWYQGRAEIKGNNMNRRTVQLKASAETLWKKKKKIGAERIWERPKQHASPRVTVARKMESLSKDGLNSGNLWLWSSGCALQVWSNLGRGS